LNFLAGITLGGFITLGSTRRLEADQQ